MLRRLCLGTHAFTTRISAVLLCAALFLQGCAGAHMIRPEPAPAVSIETQAPAPESIPPSSSASSKIFSSEDSSEISSSVAASLEAAAADGESALPPGDVAAENKTGLEGDGTAAGGIVTATIPEGYTMARIASLLEKSGVCLQDELITTVNNFDFSGYPLIAALKEDPNRCFKLEGYLFPDTYQFYRNEKPEAALERFLRNTEAKLGDDIRAAAAEQGMSMDEVLTLASIIQKEATGPTVMSGVSAVLHNRLALNMKLQCDVTIVYVEGAIKPFMTGDINRYNSFYNTYKCPALPAGPICNPGLAAVKAALVPDENENLYFIADREGAYHFTETWEQHLENIERAGLQKPDSKEDAAI